jgi:hypothetical protein
MDLSNYWFQAGKGAEPGYQLGDSLRFRGAQDLTRVNASTGNTARYTLSVWLKVAETNTAANEIVLMATNSSVNPEGYIGLSGIWQQRVYNPGVGTLNDYSMDTVTYGVYRDPSAWYHYCFAVDSTAANLDDRARLYINGVEVSLKSSTGSTKHVDQGSTIAFTEGGETVYIGRRHNGTRRWNGYMSEFHFIDGQTLDPTEFGEFNDDGVWVPKRVSGVTYGTNGFYLDFSDASDIGADRSGNGNDFTATGFELANTSNVNYDLMTDSPTNNYSTLNPITPLFTTAGVGGLADTTDANLTEYTVSGSGSSGAYVNGNTINIPANNTSQFYFEMTPTAGSGVGAGTTNNGIAFTPARLINEGTLPSNYFVGSGSVPGISAWNRGSIGNYGTTIVGAFTAITAYGQTMQVEVNGRDVRINTQGNLSAGQVVTFTLPADEEFVIGGIGYKNHTNAFNFGQQPFKHSSPAGFNGLSTAELPEVTITDPSDHFEVITDTGANILTAAQAKFSNGLWWIKDRANSNNHQLVDSIRGNNVAMGTNIINHNFTYAAPSGNSVAWCWSAPKSITNSAGSNGATLDTTVHRNKDSGFAIIEFTGNKQSNTKIYHGLGKAPKFMYVKTQEVNDWWVAYHANSGDLDSTSGADWYYEANTSDARKSYTLRNMWDRTDPDDNLITLGPTDETNRNGGLMIAYAWAEIPGYSAFGSYSGNGSTDGPFVYTGFRPAFLLVKCYNTSGDFWVIQDNKRDTYNPVEQSLYPNLDRNELALNQCDFLSNGFKLRNNGTNHNYSNRSYIYAAFAENPFGGSNVSPVTAR